MALVVFCCGVAACDVSFGAMLDVGSSVSPFFVKSDCRIREKFGERGMVPRDSSAAVAM
jgi:hypothetical protein